MSTPSPALPRRAGEGVPRFLLGLYVLVHFALLLPWSAEVFSNRGVLPDATASPLAHLFPNVLALYDAPWFVTSLVGASTVLAALLALGKHDRKAALALWYVWACLLGRNPLIANPGLPYIGWLLLAHAAGWKDDLREVAWILMAVGYTYSGLTKLPSPSWLDGSAIARVLECPLARPGLLRDALRASPVLPLLAYGTLAAELSFAPLALVRRARPWIWTAMVSMHLGIIAVVNFTDLSLGMLVLHALTFDPAWVPRLEGTGERLLYDGGCGLCHRVVRFVLAEHPTAFRFAPLPEDARSVVVETQDGRRLERADAIAHVLARLGGAWRVLAFVLARLPLRNAGYDLVASVRHHAFPRPESACPIVPRELRDRFEPAMRNIIAEGAETRRGHAEMATGRGERPGATRGVS